MKNLLSTFALTTAFFFTGCETEVPENDVTPPVLYFELRGEDGFSFVYNSQEFDPEAEIKIYLTEGDYYTFNYSARDEGGLAKMEFGYWERMFTMQREIPAPLQFSSSQSISKIFWLGDESDPRANLIFTNTFQVIKSTSPGSEVYSINLNAEDFTLDDAPGEYEKNAINVNFFIRAGDYEPRVEID